MNRNVTAVRGVVRLGEPKTKRSRRRVKLGASTVDVLRTHRDAQAAQAAHAARMGAGWHDEGLVFPTVDGRPRNPVSLSLAFAALVGRTGLPRVTLHALRHAHGTLLLDQGVPVHTVAARLGHDPAMLLRVYAHTDDSSQGHAAGLDVLLDGARPPLVALDGESRDHNVTTDAPALEANSG